MHAQDLWKLIGVAIVIAGIALRLRTTLVVMIAALATGLAAGLPLFTAEGPFAHAPLLARPGQTGIVNLLGRAFAENRLMTLFIITLPAIGLSERFGLQRQSAALIGRIRAATVGRLQFVYQLFRVLHGAVGIRLNGHPSFVRPLVFPMSAGTLPGATPAQRETIKAANAAAENYGNFYGQNLSPVQAGILLVYGVMAGLGLPVSVWSLVKYTLPVVAASLLLSAAQFLWLDRRLRPGAEGGR